MFTLLPQHKINLIHKKNLKKKKQLPTLLEAGSRIKRTIRVKNKNIAPKKICIK